MRTTTEKLAAIQGRPTAYEVLAVPAKGEKTLVAFTERKSGPGLLSALRVKGDLVVEVFGITDEAATWGKGCKSITFPCSEKFGGSVTFAFGETERTTILEGGHLPVETLCGA